MNYFILLHLTTMMLARHVPCCYLRSFQKNVSHGSDDEMMLLTTNKRWNYFTTLPPAIREDSLPVSSLSPMRRHLRDNVILAVVVVVVVVNRAVAINVVIVVVVVVIHCAIAVVVILVAVHCANAIFVVDVVQNHHPHCRPLPLPPLLLLPRDHCHCDACRRRRIPSRSPPPGRRRCPWSRRSPLLLFRLGCHPAAAVFGGG
jgi:hypothetical protein